jgi:hypothetical protein
MQRTEPEFEQAQAFEVGVAYPTPQKLGAALNSIHARRFVSEI